MIITFIGIATHRSTQIQHTISRQMQLTQGILQQASSLQKMMTRQKRVRWLIVLRPQSCNIKLFSCTNSTFNIEYNVNRLLLDSIDSVMLHSVMSIILIFLCEYFSDHSIRKFYIKLYMYIYSGTFFWKAMLLIPTPALNIYIYIYLCKQCYICIIGMHAFILFLWHSQVNLLSLKLNLFH